ncbi:MAG: monovalent cation/H(+) antiporter subunit G [bacterium]
MMINTTTIILISIGLFFFFGAIIGLLRFPDFYTRMHAAGKGDTLSTVLMLSGFAVFYLHDIDHLSLSTILVSLKILLICVFIFLASPTATHAIMDAGERTGVKHWSKEDEDDDSAS